MKKIAALALTGLMLTGCSDGVPTNPVPVSQNQDEYLGSMPWIYEIKVTLKDGRILPCVWMAGNNGGLTCDWSKP